MIKLETQNLHIKQIENQIIVLKNQKGKLTLFLEETKVNSIDILIEENVDLLFVEIGEKLDINLNIEINDNSTVRYNVLSLSEGFNSNRIISLEEGASLLVGYADFSNGEKQVKATINLNKRNSRVDWHLASLTQNNDKKTYQIDIIHHVENTYANMDNYGVCKNNSTLEFFGDATIVKGAKKSSTHQNAKIMVFDEKCHAKTSPKLCIYENDVEASHGASEGKINPDHVYYLMTRGLKEEEAKRLITLGYLNPICEYFIDEDLIEKIRNRIVEGI